MGGFKFEHQPKAQPPQTAVPTAPEPSISHVPSTLAQELARVLPTRSARQDDTERDTQFESGHSLVAAQRYERDAARQELLDFKMKSFSGEVNLQQMTGAGSAFKATYIPMIQTLWIQVPVMFEFRPGFRYEPIMHGQQPATMVRRTYEWKPGEADGWKKEFLELVSRKWSGKHIFYCQKDWWEDLRAIVKVDFEEQTTSSATTYHVEVQRTVPDRPRVAGSRVYLGYELIEVDETGRSGAAHEAGHMLGLDDEYKGKIPGEEAQHSSLVEAEFGHKVIRGQTEPSLMAGGSGAILPQHGVTFLQALKQVTKMNEWSAHPKPPRRILLRAGGSK